MSSTSIIETEPRVTEGAQPTPPTLPRQKLGESLLSRLDIFLSEPLRQSSPEERGRHRLLVGIALVVMLIGVLPLLFLPVSTQPRVHATIALLCTVGSGSALVLLRRRSSPELPARLVCSTLAGTFMFAILAREDPRTASHAATMLIPALSVYLIGARPGLVLTGLMALFVGLVHPLVFTSLGLKPMPAAPGQVWRDDFFTALSMLGIWAVCWLHATAREQAHAARAQALKTLHESERKLSSLIENTSDLVCSVDTEGRLVVANSAMLRAFRERYGREPRPGEPLFDPKSPERHSSWMARLAEAFAGQSVRVEDVFQQGDRVQVVDITFNPVFGEDGQPLGLTLFGRDITERKEAETKLSEMHRTLLDVSRQAGMAEVATGLLHNVGNTLNSVNVSANLVTERIRNSRVVGLTRVAELLSEHAGDPRAFFSTDPRGQQLPAYLIALAGKVAEERQSLLNEQQLLTEGLEHVKSIVSMQQAHARFAGMVEQVLVPRLIDDALRLHSVSFERQGIEIHREYAEVPPILLDRHKLLQILLNLLSNARHALLDSERADKRLAIRVLKPAEDRLCIQVSDNGVGISPEGLTRLFTQGFTTKKNGHGFGLHISALAATEMEGSLTGSSAGPGQGATFTIELPLRRDDSRA